MLYPDKFEEVLAAQPSKAECCTTVAPVPVTAIVAGETVALLVIVTVPLEAVVPVGANVKDSVTFCPGVSVTGGVTPLDPKPVPVTATFEIVKLELPELVSVTVWVPGRTVVDAAKTHVIRAHTQNKCRSNAGPGQRNRSR